MHRMAVVFSHRRAMNPRARASRDRLVFTRVAAAAGAARCETPEMALVPDYLEPLRGYRIWYVRHGSHHIESLCGTRWAPFEALEARHHSAPLGDRSAVGAATCSGPPCGTNYSRHYMRCGIYAFSSRNALLNAVRYGPFSTLRAPLIVGEVWLWGRFAQHEYGYRAQFAYPARFTGGFRCDPVHVAATYGVSYEEDESWTSVFKSIVACQSPYATPFPSVTVSAGKISATAAPIPPAVSLRLGGQLQTRAAERPNPSPSVFRTCSRLVTQVGRSEVRRMLASIRLWRPS
jgi:hypothetical protein